LWLSKNKKVFDDVEIPVLLVAKQSIELCNLCLAEVRGRKKEGIQV
jgi:hypothetical protein